MKETVHYFIHSNKTFLKFLYGLIILNVISIVLESYNQIALNYQSIFYYFELFSVIVFTIEYVLRIWTAEYEYENSLISSKKLKFIFSKFGIIDFLSIIPFYLPFLIPFDLRVLRILRLFRLLRIFKLGRFSKSMKTIGSVLKETKSDLAITLFVALILLILSSSLMYYIESEAQPEKFENIGQSLWWSVATLTTVGYGDIYPIIGVGKILSAIIALIGIGFIALPTGIISFAFISKIQSEKNQCKCPNFGAEF